MGTLYLIPTETLRKPMRVVELSLVSPIIAAWDLVSPSSSGVQSVAPIV